MADESLVSRATSARAAANYCRTLASACSGADKAIDEAISPFVVEHEGVGITRLRKQYAGWDGNLTLSANQLQAVAKRCDEQASSWEAEYARQQAEDAARARAQQQAEAAMRQAQAVSKPQ